MRYTFPDTYAESRCYLVAIPAALIPLVAGALKPFEERRSWGSDAEYEQAYNAFAELQLCMMKCCLDELINSNNRLYRLIDTAMFGTMYEVTNTDPLEVSPTIPEARDIGIDDQQSVLGRMNRMQWLLENALNGTTNDEYTDQDGIRQLIAQLKTAIEQNGQLDDDMLAKLGEIALLVG